jgi:hypothetical protein
MDNFEEKACTCALNRIFGFTPRTGYALISHLGGASEVFRISREDLEAMLGRASRHIGQIGLEAVTEGTGLVFDQLPSPGQTAATGTQVLVYLKED